MLLLFFGLSLLSSLIVDVSLCFLVPFTKKKAGILFRFFFFLSIAGLTHRSFSFCSLIVIVMVRVGSVVNVFFLLDIYTFVALSWCKDGVGGVYRNNA